MFLEVAHIVLVLHRDSFAVVDLAVWATPGQILSVARIQGPLPPPFLEAPGSGYHLGCRRSEPEPHVRNLNRGLNCETELRIQRVEHDVPSQRGDVDVQRLTFPPRLRRGQLQGELPIPHSLGLGTL